jgi:hypothetical protein
MTARSARIARTLCPAFIRRAACNDAWCPRSDAKIVASAIRELVAPERTSKRPTSDEPRGRVVLYFDVQADDALDGKPPQQEG